MAKSRIPKKKKSYDMIEMPEGVAAVSVSADGKESQSTPHHLRHCRRPNGCLGCPGRISILQLFSVNEQVRPEKGMNGRRQVSAITACIWQPSFF